MAVAGARSTLSWSGTPNISAKIRQPDQPLGAKPVRKKVGRTCVLIRVGLLLAGAHTRHPATLALPHRAFLDVPTEKLVDLIRLDVIADVLPVRTQRTLNAKDERPVGPLWREGRRRAVPAWLVRRARGRVVAEAQVRHRGTAACALEAVTLCVDLGKGRDDGGEGDEACACAVNRALAWTAVKRRG
jgi:hypothetical protein